MADNLITLHDHKTSHDSDCLLLDACQVQKLHHHQSDVRSKNSNESVLNDAMPAPLDSTQIIQENHSSLVSDKSMGSKTFEQFKIPKSIQQRQQQNLYNIAPTVLTTFFRDRFVPNLNNGPLIPISLDKSRNNSSPVPDRNITPTDGQLTNTPRRQSDAETSPPAEFRNPDHLTIQKVTDTERVDIQNERSTDQHQEGTQDVSRTTVTNAHVQTSSEFSGLDILCSVAFEQEKIERLQSASRPNSIHSNGSAEHEAINTHSRSASQRNTPDTPYQIPAETSAEQQESSTQVNMQQNNQPYGSPVHSQRLYIPYSMTGHPNIPNNQNPPTGLPMSMAAPVVPQQKYLPISGTLPGYTSRGMPAHFNRSLPRLAYQLHPSYIAREPPMKHMVSHISQSTACPMPELSGRASMSPSVPLRGYPHVLYPSGPKDTSNLPSHSASGETRAFESTHMQCPIHSEEDNRKGQGYPNIVGKLNSPSSSQSNINHAQYLHAQNITDPNIDRAKIHQFPNSRKSVTHQISTVAQNEVNKSFQSNELESNSNRLGQNSMHMSPSQSSGRDSKHSGSRRSETIYADPLTRQTDSHVPEVIDINAPSASIQFNTHRHSHNSVPNIPTDIDHIKMKSTSKSKTQSAPSTPSNGNPPTVTSSAPTPLIAKDNGRDVVSDCEIIFERIKTASSEAGHKRRQKGTPTDNSDDLSAKKRRRSKEQAKTSNKITKIQHQANRGQPIQTVSTISGKSLAKIVPSCDTFVPNSMQNNAFMSQGQELAGTISDVGYRQRWKKPTNADIECKLCQHRVKYSVPWKKHIREMHWDLVENFVCKECIMPFACKEEFMAHVKMLHPKMYPCNLIPDKHLQPIMEELRTYRGRSGQVNEQPLETSPDGLTQAGPLSGGNPQFQSGSASSIIHDSSMQIQVNPQQINVSSAQPLAMPQNLAQSQQPVAKSLVETQPFAIPKQPRVTQQQPFIETPPIQVRQQCAEQLNTRPQQRAIGPEPPVITPQTSSVRSEQPDDKYQQPHINVMSQQQFVNIQKSQMCPQQPTIRSYQPDIQHQSMMQQHTHFAQPTTSPQEALKRKQQILPDLRTSSIKNANEKCKSDVHNDTSGTHIHTTNTMIQAQHYEQLGHITATSMIPPQLDIRTRPTSDIAVLQQNVHGNSSITPTSSQGEQVSSQPLSHSSLSSTSHKLVVRPSRNIIHHEAQVHSQANDNEDAYSKISSEKMTSAAHGQIMLATSPKPLAIALSEANLISTNHANMNSDNSITVNPQATKSEDQCCTSPPSLSREEIPMVAAPENKADFHETGKQSNRQSQSDPVTDRSRLDGHVLAPGAADVSCNPESEHSTLVLKCDMDGCVPASCFVLQTDPMLSIEDELDSIDGVDRHIQNTSENMVEPNKDETAVPELVSSKSEVVQSTDAMDLDEDDAHINTSVQGTFICPSEIHPDQQVIEHKPETENQQDDLEGKYASHLVETTDMPIDIKVEPSTQSDAENDDASTKSYANSPDRLHDVESVPAKSQKPSEDTSPSVLSVNDRMRESRNNSIYSASDAHRRAIKQLTHIEDPGEVHMTDTRYTGKSEINHVIQCVSVPIITPPDSDCSQSPPAYIEVGSRDTKLNIRPKIVKWTKKRNNKRAKPGKQKAKFFFPKLVKYVRKPSKSRLKDFVPIYEPIDEANDATLPDLISCEETYTTRLTKSSPFGIMEENEPAVKSETWNDKPDFKDTPLQINTKDNITPSVHRSEFGTDSQDNHKPHQTQKDNHIDNTDDLLKEQHIIRSTEGGSRHSIASDNEATKTQLEYDKSSEATSTVCSDRPVSVMDIEETFGEVSSIWASAANDEITNDRVTPNTEPDFCTKTCKIKLKRMPLLNSISKLGYVTVGNDGSLNNSLTNSTEFDDGDADQTVSYGPLARNHLPEIRLENETGQGDMTLNQHETNDGRRELESVVNEDQPTPLECFQPTEITQIENMQPSLSPRQTTELDARNYSPSQVNSESRQPMKNEDIHISPQFPDQVITDCTHIAESPLFLHEKDNRIAVVPTTDDQSICTETEPVTASALQLLRQKQSIKPERTECVAPRLLTPETLHLSSSISEGANEALSNSNPPSICDKEWDNFDLQSIGTASPFGCDMLANPEKGRHTWEEQKLNNDVNIDDFVLGKQRLDELVSLGNDCKHSKDGLGMVDEDIAESENVPAKISGENASEVIVGIEIESSLTRRPAEKLDLVPAPEPLDSATNDSASPRPLADINDVPSKDPEISSGDISSQEMTEFSENLPKQNIQMSDEVASQHITDDLGVDASENDEADTSILSTTACEDSSANMSKSEENTLNSFGRTKETSIDELADETASRCDENSLSESHAVISNYVTEHQTQECSDGDLLKQLDVDSASANDYTGQNSSDSEEDPEWGCLLCTYSSSEKAVKAHIIKTHIVEKHFFCPKCSQNSLNYSDVEHHILDVHKDVTAVVMSKRCTRANDLVSSLCITLPSETKWRNVKAKVQKAEKMSNFIKTRMDLNDDSKYVCHVCCKLIRTEVLIRRHVALHWKAELIRSLEDKPKEVNSDDDILLELFNNKKIRTMSRRTMAADRYVPSPPNQPHQCEYLVSTSQNNQQQHSAFDNLNPFEVMQPSQSPGRNLKVKLKRINASFLSTGQSTTAMPSVLHSPTSPSPPYSWDSPVPNSPTKTDCFSFPNTIDAMPYASQTSPMDGVQPEDDIDLDSPRSTTDAMKTQEVCYEEPPSPALSLTSQTSCCTCSSTVTMPYQTATQTLTSTSRCHVYRDCYRSYVGSDIKLSMRPVVQIEHLRVT